MAHELNIDNIASFSGFGADELVEKLVDLLVENKIGNQGKYDGLISGDIALGNYVDMGGYTWRVCHIDESAGEFYLILNVVTETVQYDDYQVYAGYAGSLLAAKCTSFAETLPADVRNLLLMKTVSGVTAKIWVPDYNQVNQGFDLFDSEASRVAYNVSGLGCEWWISSNSQVSDNKVWYVGASGTFYNGSNALYECGFRPCVALKL